MPPSLTVSVLSEDVPGYLTFHRFDELHSALEQSEDIDTEMFQEVAADDDAIEQVNAGRPVEYTKTDRNT